MTGRVLIQSSLISAEADLFRAKQRSHDMSREGTAEVKGELEYIPKLLQPSSSSALDTPMWPVLLSRRASLR